MFAYCNNNPIMYSDPSGHSVIFTCIIIGAIVGAAAGGCAGAAISKAKTGKVNGWAVLGGVAGGAVVGGLIGWGVGAAVTAIGATATGTAATTATPLIDKISEKTLQIGGSLETVVRFSTNFGSFIPDESCSVPGALISSIPGVIQIMDDIVEVGFR